MYHRQAGFTLIELLVGLALMVVVMAAIGGMLSAFLRHGAQGVAQIQRQQEARWIIDMIAQDVQFATEFRGGTASASAIEVIKKDTRNNSVRVRYELEDAGTGNDNQILRRRVWIPASNTNTTDEQQVSNMEYGYVGKGDFVVTPAVTELENGTRRVVQVSLTYRIRKNQGDASPQTAQTTVYFPSWRLLVPSNG